ncbi:MAG: UDP-N-acetylmuramoyl-L-alanyl-D-glutamate--2,6-diaminopimelate ligase [Deltaproteobacteria bacterium]|nr:UDP-N-acetylmuramoyl-L-alanyl-D-glutamate--2,6-diaminopimelate ligase [Deltaproteobacteria bacterium]
MTVAPLDLVRAIEGELVAGDLASAGELSDVTRDSRRVGPGVVFVAVRGTSRDGMAFAADAVREGAAIVVVERGALQGSAIVRERIDGTVVPVVTVADARVALARAAHVIFGDPTAELDVVGITGTNGKTTTSYLVEGVLAACGGRVARMGTIAYALPGEKPTPAPLTTPESDDVARFARAARDRGATHLVMEVSSHALSMARVEGVRFSCAVFTNLTQDHLDFHGTMAAYEAAKRRLFVEHGPRTAAINVDDPVGRRFAAATGARVIAFGRTASSADVTAVEARFDRDGLVARVRFPDGERDVRSPFVGAHNLENVLAALSVAVALGLDLDKAIEGVAAVAGVPGRLERVAHPRGALVVVDYAHTPDALERALAALRPITPRRLLCVFGCGGDRDRGKRPLMGEAVARGADVAIVTDDNPRTERREDIHAAIVDGVVRAGARHVEPDELETASSAAFTVVPDRAGAIAAAVRAAGDGDTVLLAGKGHEDYQIVGTVKRPFDDRLEALRAVGLATPAGA